MTSPESPLVITQQISDLPFISSLSVSTLTAVEDGTRTTYKASETQRIALFNSNLQLNSVSQITGLVSALAGKLSVANNLDDVASSSTSRTNLGLGSGNSPIFTGLNLSGLTASSLIATDGSKNLTSSVASLSPTFTGLNLSGLTASSLISTDSSRNLTSISSVGTAQGGTGQTSYTDGQILIGLTAGNTLQKGTIVAGIGIAVNYNSSTGELTITNTNVPASNPETSVGFINSPYHVLDTDSFLSVDVTGGPVTILLQDNPPPGFQLVVKDVYGQSSLNHITISTVSGIKTIDNATSFVISNNLGAANIGFSFSRDLFSVF